jgi:hypothetical protein
VTLTIHVSQLSQGASLFGTFDNARSGWCIDAKSDCHGLAARFYRPTNPAHPGSRNATRRNQIPRSDKGLGQMQHNTNRSVVAVGPIIYLQPLRQCVHDASE